MNEPGLVSTDGYPQTNGLRRSCLLSRSFYGRILGEKKA